MTKSSGALARLIFPLGFRALVLTGALLGVAGCATPTPLTQEDMEPERQVLRAGDRIRVFFPGAQSLETTQVIRPDGKINLTMGGEIAAAGRTPVELEEDILKLIGNQLVVKEVKVTVIESSFSVFVTGAVMKPGKVTPTQAITALEAIMEAGGFDSAKANTKEVLIIRQLPGGRTKNYILDLQAVLDGKSSDPFYLRHNDMIIVREKFVWF